MPATACPARSATPSAMPSGAPSAVLSAPGFGAPFPSAEAAWFWTAAVLLSRRDPAVPPPQPGPCRAEEVVRCLDALYRQRRVDLVHARILRIWGFRGVAPNPAWPRERCDWRLWAEALERLDWPLRTRGIVVGPRGPAGQAGTWDVEPVHA